MLVNPRDMRLPENQNNFPSKVMDYLAAGKVIISTKFAGWERFKENIIFCESSVEGIKEGLEDVQKHLRNAEEVYGKNRKKAAEFVWKKQIEKIF